MPIGSAVQNGAFININDERGRRLSTINVGTSARLQGYTATSVSVRQGFFINTYDEKGRRIGTAQAR